MLCHPLITTTHGFCRINEKRNAIGIVKLTQCSLIELFAKGVFWLVQPGRVNNNQLEIGAIYHPAKTTARCLCHRRGNGNLFFQARI